MRNAAQGRKMESSTSTKVPPRRVNGRGRGTEVNETSARWVRYPLRRRALLAKTDPFGALYKEGPNEHHPYM